MIDIKELRIGNYVLVNSPRYEYPEIKEVFNIQEESASLKNTGVCVKHNILVKGEIIEHNPPIIIANPYVYQLISPVPLTVELILKCGFRKEQDKFYRADFGNVILNQYGFYLQLKECTSETIRVIKIESLNQLQNIYYCLRSKELEVKL